MHLEAESRGSFLKSRAIVSERPRVDIRALRVTCEPILAGTGACIAPAFTIGLCSESWRMMCNFLGDEAEAYVDYHVSKVLLDDQDVMLLTKVFSVKLVCLSLKRIERFANRAIFS